MDFFLVFVEENQVSWFLKEICTNRIYNGGLLFKYASPIRSLVFLAVYDLVDT